MSNITILNNDGKAIKLDSSNFSYKLLMEQLHDFNSQSYTTLTLDKYDENFVNNFNALIGDKVKEELLDNGREDVCECNYRVNLDKSYQLIFSWEHDEDDRQIVVGFWISSLKFIIVWETDSPYVEISHYHPGSMTSGIWISAYGNLTEDIDYQYQLLDDAGIFYYFGPAIKDEMSLSREILHLVEGQELRGVQSFLWIYWFYFKDSDNSINDVVIDIFPTTYSNGYTIDNFTVNASDAVISLLHPTISKAHAEEWLKYINENFNIFVNAEHYDIPLLDVLVPILKDIVK
jgi:hypothetical protein